MSKILLAVLFTLMLVTVDGYSRFGSNRVQKVQAVEEAPKSINDQILQGSPVRYYGRFRGGNDDVLNRYFNRLL